ncbi:hypothetical protein NM208_g11654 [Fusarium decemcellulare]|uniref:Uncharacterized protein n=1 Tax=Fusarium decemcellulare TaxID=57161 RepID=A0ACC1RS41_9HYPO|nr:hypothetical protein NM208_g11654 [Fusarium decemcellulare]
MATSPDLTWHQVTPGVWQRDIDELEQFYATMVVLYEGSGRMFFGMTGHVSLTIKNIKNLSQEEAEREVDNALRKAWLALRHAHPTMAAKVTQNLETGEWTKTYHQIQEEADKAAWLEQTLVSITSGQTGNEWANSDPPAPNVPTMFVLHLPPSTNDDGSSTIRRDLVFRSPHDIIDGIGTLMMLNNFVTLAAEAYEKGDSYQPPALDGSETPNLSPAYRVAARVPDELTEAQKKLMESNATQKAAVVSDPSVELLALPFRAGGLVPGRHQRLALTLSQEDTSRLVASCKAAGATPTHAFHAAAAIVARDIQERPAEPKRVRYINYILRNERSSCAEPYNTSKHPAAVYHSVSGQSLVVDMDLPAAGTEISPEARRKEFLSVLETMKTFYHAVKEDKEHSILTPTMWGLGTPPLPLSPRPLPVPPPKAHPSVSISSMGRTDSIVAPENGAFSTFDPWVTGEELGNGLGLFLGTSRSELCLSAAYNDAWHMKDDVDQYLKCCKEVVFWGFDINHS